MKPFNVSGFLLQFSTFRTLVPKKSANSVLFIRDSLCRYKILRDIGKALAKYLDEAASVDK